MSQYYYHWMDVTYMVFLMVKAVKVAAATHEILLLALWRVLLCEWCMCANKNLRHTFSFCCFFKRHFEERCCIPLPPPPPPPLMLPTWKTSPRAAAVTHKELMPIYREKLQKKALKKCANKKKISARRLVFPPALLFLGYYVDCESCAGLPV